jgi:hypothetical protein
LRSANAYTDQQIAGVMGGNLDRFRQQVDDRFRQVDTHMSRIGAMSAASTHMAISAAGARGRGRLAAGVGFYGGKSALSVGYAAPLGDRANVNFGGAFSGSEASAGIGFGVDL